MALSLATLLVARTGGAAVVGAYALMRMLPWLTGVVGSAGLPVASAHVLAADREADPRLPWTLLAMVVGASTVGSLLWWAASPLLAARLLPTVPSGLVALAAITVTTQLVTVTAKACCQGRADMVGANLVIVAEEFCFLPAYGAALLAGLADFRALLAGLAFGGAAAALVGVARLVATGFWHFRGRPSWTLARSIASYGARAQLGNLLMLVNLRLDFIVLGVLAGPAVLGVYAIASKFAELMRLPATAVNYVLYPRFSAAERAATDRQVRSLASRATGLTVLAAPVLCAAAVVALPWLYGAEFTAAVLPACVLLAGLAVEGATAVCSAYLWGIGRPGVQSAATGGGVLVTVALDLALIPAHGALGAAVASSIAYVAVAALLAALTWRLSRGEP